MKTQDHFFFFSHSQHVPTLELESVRDALNMVLQARLSKLKSSSQAFGKSGKYCWKEPDWQVDYSDLQILDQIGEGSSGKVYLGKFREGDVAGISKREIYFWVKFFK